MLLLGELFGRFLSEYKKIGVGWLVGILLPIAAFFLYQSIPPGTLLQWRIYLAKPGATINLKPGRIERNIAIAKSIILAGNQASSRNAYAESAKTILGGIVISGDSDVQVTLRDIHVYGRIAISDEASVTLHNMRMSVEGVVISDHAQVALLGSHLRGGGVLITDHAQVTLRDTQVRGGGITITDDVQATLWDIQVSGGGIVISDSASARMMRATVSGNKRGLFVQQSAHVQLSDCVFLNNIEVGTLVADNGILQGERCRWVEDWRVGIRVAGSGSIELTACTIRDSRQYGLVLENEASAVLADTAIHGTGEADPMSGGTIRKEYTSRYQWGSGVLLTDDSNLSLTDCTITGSTLHGIVAFDNASLSLANSRDTASAEIGIVTFDNASVVRKAEE
jgi:nitrous oxidase accessory protein NosD